MARRTGPAKVRVPGTNRWVLPEELEADAAPVADDFDESGWEAASDLGPRPEPTPKPVLPDEPMGHYYHAYMPNLRVKRGRKDALRWMGGLIYYKTAEQRGRIQKALAKYVPGRDPERWHGDTPGIDEDLRCHECGYFTRNINVWRDHGRHTGHFRT